MQHYTSTHDYGLGFTPRLAYREIRRIHSVFISELTVRTHKLVLLKPWDTMEIGNIPAGNTGV
jgi:hypothetical protein